MCSSKAKLQDHRSSTSNINGRPVLQPNRFHHHRAPLLERCNSLPLINSSSNNNNSSFHRNNINADEYTMMSSQLVLKPLTTALPPSPRITQLIKANDHDQCHRATAVKPPPNNKSLLNKSKSFKYSSSSMTVDAPAAGSIAAARREQVAYLQEQRKMRIAHYGRTTAKASPVKNIISITCDNEDQVKRCTFITPNSDPISVAYHDEEWGVPVHHDQLLFELLVLTGAQVGSDWSSVLRKRQDYRDAFSRFDVEIVSKYSEKKMSLISSEDCIELSLVRGVVDNSKKILEIKKEFGSFDKYLWGFVNGKPIVTQYKWCHKIPAKTSKSEAISKDMVRRGFRQVGPTVIHSFMQAAGLTNDHLITCPSRHAAAL